MLSYFIVSLKFIFIWSNRFSLGIINSLNLIAVEVEITLVIHPIIIKKIILCILTANLLISLAWASYILWSCIYFNLVLILLTEVIIKISIKETISVLVILLSFLLTLITSKTRTHGVIYSQCKFVTSNACAHPIIWLRYSEIWKILCLDFILFLITFNFLNLWCYILSKVLLNSKVILHLLIWVW